MSLPLTKAVLEQLAKTRLAEAEHLLREGFVSGAYYLGGIAVELAVKACIADQFFPRAIPDKRFVESVYTHDLLKLVDLAGLDAERISKLRADAIFARHWESIRAWSPTTRYVSVKEESARDLIDALSDADHGVFEWIRSHW